MGCFENVKEGDVFLLTWENKIHAFGTVKKCPYESSNVSSIKNTLLNKKHSYDSGVVRYNIANVTKESDCVVPFTLDMSLLYEHYVYGLLESAYPSKIKYQCAGLTGKPDFLYCSPKEKYILDTKYIPKYRYCEIDTYVIRQLSGYARDMKILRALGFDDVDENSNIPSVPCVIIYPVKGTTERKNPFLDKPLNSLMRKIDGVIQFYAIEIPVPMLHNL